MKTYVISNAIDRLKAEFYNSNTIERDKQIISQMHASSADLKIGELN